MGVAAGNAAHAGPVPVISLLKNMPSRTTPVIPTADATTATAMTPPVERPDDDELGEEAVLELECLPVDDDKTADPGEEDEADPEDDDEIRPPVELELARPVDEEEDTTPVDEL